MERKKTISIDSKLIIKKCDKNCGTCYNLINRGTWYQCAKDSKEVHLGEWCASYRGDGH